MVFYTQTTGVIINVVVCVIALIAIGVSLFFMTARSGLSWKAVFTRYLISFGIQIVSLALAAGLSALVAVFMDGVGRPSTWFSENWLILGLFFCPMFFGMGILPAYYLERTKKVSTHCSYMLLQGLIYSLNAHFFRTNLVWASAFSCSCIRTVCSSSF